MKKILLSIMLSGAAILAQADSGTLPNIVILYADDMGYGDTSYQNPGGGILTPHLDKLASEGVRFTDGHSSSGICTPSRYAMLTGRYHWRKFHGIVNSFGKSVFDDELTMPQMLREKGYTTACFGKWHLGWDWSAVKNQGAKKVKVGKKTAWGLDAFDWSKPVPGGPCDRGFDYYYGDGTINFPPYAWMENDHFIKPPNVMLEKSFPAPLEGPQKVAPGPASEGWSADQVLPELTRRAAEWIGEQKDGGKPFFLYFPFTSPHAPIVPTEKWQGSSKAGPFGDLVQQTDWCVGQVLQALEKNGFAQNTIVVFSSDNGPEHYAWERIGNTGHRSMGELRGIKRDVWEGGHRVPFLVRWPGVVEPGRTSTAMFHQVDLMATFAGLVGYELPKTAAEDSFNQLELLQGAPDAKAVRPSMIHNTREEYGFRKGDWLYINAPYGSKGKKLRKQEAALGYTENMDSVCLYNLKKDLAQKTNLSKKYPEKVQEMDAELNTIREQGFSAPHATK
jgi:arylsulfatase A